MNQRKRKTIINNIESINMEIDYEKLAEAIVKANNKAKEQNRYKINARFWTMAEFNLLFYSTIGATLATFVGFIWWNGLIDSVFGRIMVSILMALFSVASFKCAFESAEDKEIDAHNHFNTNVSLVALILALVALFKG